MAHVVKLGGVERTFGDLTGAHLEDHFAEIDLLLQKGALTKEKLSAIFTLAHASLVAGGATGLTRDELRKVVRFADLKVLTEAVSKALGFEREEAGAGEATSP